MEEIIDGIYYRINTPSAKANFSIISANITHKRNVRVWNDLYRFEYHTEHYKVLLRKKYIAGISFKINNPVVLNMIESKHYLTNKELFDIIITEDINNKIQNEILKYEVQNSTK